MTLTLLPERIQRKIHVADNGCWEWTGYRNPKGYAQATIRQRRHLVHRFVYEYLGGVIPDGWELHHECVNTGCVNPEHMKPLDTDTHRRLKTHCPHGHSLEDAYIINGSWRRCRTCSQDSSREYQRRKARERSGA